MRHRAREVATTAVPAVALALAVGAAVAGCATATATAEAPAPAVATTGPTTTGPTTTGPITTRAAAPVYGPHAADPACVAAGNAQRTLQARQQSGAAQLPDMSQIQKDGTAFDNACSL